MKKLRKNDQVIILSGKHKGAKGTIISLDWEKNKVKVDKINVVKKHSKPSQTNAEGGIIEFEAPIDISNVALIGKSKDAKASKVKFLIKENKKLRISKQTGKEI